jgi:hypothetical protein
MGNVQEELQGKLNDVNVGYSNNDAIDVPVTMGSDDFSNTTQHKPHDAQFIDSSVAGGSFTDPVVNFVGGMLGLNSPVRTPIITTKYRPPIRAREEDLTPNTAARTEIIPTTILQDAPPPFTSVKQRLQYYEKLKTSQHDDRKQEPPTPQPQSSPPKPQSPPRPPATENKDEDESEDEPDEKKDEDESDYVSQLPKGKGFIKLEPWKNFYSVVLKGDGFVVKDMKSLPEIRQKCLELVRAKYKKITTNYPDLYKNKVFISDDPEYIYYKILKVKQIKAERKQNLEKAHKDFSRKSK